MFGKLVAILNTPIFTSARAEEELEFEPMEVEEEVGMPILIPFPSPAVEPAATVQVRTRVLIPIDDAEPPVLSVAEAELEVAKSNLQSLEEANASAKAEALILDQVYETNQLVRQLAIEMDEQRLLPSQLEERRKAAAADNESVQEMLKDLGF